MQYMFEQIKVRLGYRGEEISRQHTAALGQPQRGGSGGCAPDHTQEGPDDSIQLRVGTHPTLNQGAPLAPRGPLELSQWPNDPDEAIPRILPAGPPPTPR